MTTDELVKISRDYFTAALTSGTISILVAWLPFLGGPIFLKILTPFIKKIAEKLVDRGELAAFIMHTDLRLSKQGKLYVQAKQELRDSILIGDQEKIDAASIKAKAAFLDVASFKR